MLDENKERALIGWVNGVLKTDAKSMSDLNGGQELYRLLCLIDNENKELTSATRKDYMTGIRTGLENLFKCSMDSKLNFKNWEDGDVIEVAKVCFLLITAGLLIDHDLFIGPAMTLDHGSQTEVYHMMTNILKDDRKLENIDDEYYTILFEKLELASQLKPVVPPTSHMITSTPQNDNRRTMSPMPLDSYNSCSHDSRTTATKDNSSILAQLCPAYLSKDIECPLSPVQQLINSPSIASKIMLQQHEQRVKRLLEDLSREKLMRGELENEVQLKYEQLEDHKNTNNELTTQLAKLQRRIRQIEEETLNSSVSNDPTNNLIKDLKERNEELLTELRELKERNKFLEKENGSVYDQLNLLQPQTTSRASDKICKQRGDDLSFLVAELQEALNANESRLKCYTTAYEELKTEAEQQREMYLQRIGELTKKLEKSGLSESGECLGNIIEQNLRDQLDSVQQLLTERMDQENALMSEVRNLKEEKGLIQKSKTELESKLRETEQNYVVRCDEMDQMLIKERAVKEKLEADLDEARITSLEQISCYEAEIHAAKESSEKLKIVVDEFEKRINLAEDEMARSIESAEKDKSRLLEELKAAEERYGGLEADLVNYRTRLVTAEVNLEAHSTKMSKLTDELLLMVDELEGAKRQAKQSEVTYGVRITQLEEKLVMSRKEVVSLEEVVSLLQNREAQLEERVKTTDKEIIAIKEEMKQEMQEADSREQQLEEELEMTCGKISQLENKLEELTAENKHLEEEKEKNKELVQQLSEINNAEALRKDEEKTTIVTKLNEELMNLQVQVESKNRELQCAIADKETVMNSLKVEHDSEINNVKLDFEMKLSEILAHELKLQQDLKSACALTEDLEKKLAEAVNEKKQMEKQWVEEKAELIKISEDAKLICEEKASVKDAEIMALEAEMSKKEKEFVDLNETLMSENLLLKSEVRKKKKVPTATLR